MIFFVSTRNDFETNFLVETKDLNIGSEGNNFLVDNATLSGLNKFGNSFNIKAKKINQIDKNLPIILGDGITGSVNISSKIFLRIKSKKAELNTLKNVLKLKETFVIENEKYQISGKEIFFDFKNSSIFSNQDVTLLLPNGIIYGGKIKIVDSKDNKEKLLLFINNGVKIKYLL